jgi:lipid A 3-O-deacylase
MIYRPKAGLPWFGLTAALVLPLIASAHTANAATPAPDPDSIITLQIENDAFSLPATDRYYTAGQSLGYVLPTGVMPDFVANLGQWMFGEGSQRLAFNLQSIIFTPVDTQVYDPNPSDRPYAGQLALHTTLIQDTDTTRSLAQVSIGVVGPASLAQSIQNGFHAIIGDTRAKGWHYQLHDEPTLDFFGGRIWRDDVASFGGGDLDVQFLPQVTEQVGNTEIYAQAGGILRIGSGLDSDFGPAVIQPAMSGTDAYTPTQPFVWYIFGGASGRLVAHDMLVQGNDFRSSRGVGLNPLQGDLEVGAAIMAFGLRITATEVFESPEFHGEAPAFQYGSVAISARF